MYTFLQLVSVTLLSAQVEEKREDKVFELKCAFLEVCLLFNGYSESPFARKDTFLYCGVQKWIERGWASGDADTKKKLYPRKRHFSVIEKHIENSKQDEKHVPDLLEAIIRAPGPVKEELRQSLF